MPVKKVDNEHEELKGMIQTVIAKLEAIERKQIESEKREAERKHLDEMVITHEKSMQDNGKPGLLSIRNKVLNFESRLTAIGLLVAGDVILRVVQFFLDKQ